MRIAENCFSSIYVLCRVHDEFYISIQLFLQFINDLHGLISPNAPGTPLPLILLGKVVTHYRCNSFT